MKAIYILIVLAIASILSIAGCGDDSRMRPTQAAPIPKNAAPPKVPTTIDEKIAAINKAPIPDAEKKKAIERVRAGNL